LRKLKIFFVTLICLLSSNIAFTLGVGEIEVKSALNDPLDAEIKLFSVRPGEGDNIRVQLATLKEFEAAGIDRALILSNLKFKVVEKDGKAFIKVFSKRPIREPFLDFLVDIDWPSGRLLREYTVLLDPPVFLQRKAAAVQAPVVEKPAEVVREARPAPTPAPDFSAPVAAAPVVSESSGLFPQIQISDVAPAPRRPTPVTADTSAESYGPVKRNDTLWTIAQKVRPSGVTMTQMMVALQQANPEAFGGNNINNLKSGFILRVPGRSEIEATSAGEALRIARAQNEAWRAGRDSAPSTGTISTRESQRRAPAPVAKVDPEVKLVTPEGKKGTGQGSGTDDSKELVLANEQLASKQKENSELQERMQALQDQIESMERLLQLKDESLSDLQGKLSDTEQAPAAVEPVAPTPAPVVEKQPEPVAEPEPVVAATDDVINPYAVKDIPKVTPKPAATQTPATPAQDDGILAGLLNNTAILGALIAVVVGVLALVWIVIQRRRMSAMQFPESILTSKPDVATQPVSVPATEPGQDETSLLSDFAPSAMQGVIETDAGEVDPLSEANVYLAYGKHQQAEELLVDAVKQEPERLDLKLKLMEVFHATGNVDSFIEQATQMHDGLDDQSSALWEKATEMGQELCPDHALFKAEELAAEDDFSDLEGLADIDEDLSLAINEEPEISIDEELTLDTDSSDDLSLDMEALDEVEEDNFSIDLDSDLTLDTDTVSEQPAEVVKDTDLGEFDLDVLAEIEDVSVEAEEPLATEVEPEIAEDDDILGMDEVATKLDLAKAYIDMGDPDGARAILDEVLTEGTDTQKDEAKALIDQL